MRECFSVAKKKELKKLIERIEAIEAEIKAFKETAEKNVATISAEIEKLVAVSKPVAEAPVKRTRKAVAPVKKATTPAKPTRKPRAKKTDAAVQEKTAATEQVETAPAEEKKKPAQKQTEPKAARTRKPRTAEPKTRAPRQWKGVSFVLYNCDEAKSPESLYNRNDETFKDAGTGRRALWSKLKTEIAEGRIKILDNVPMDNIRLEIIDGKPESVSKHLQYGLIEKVEPKE